MIVSIEAVSCSEPRCAVAKWAVIYLKMQMPPSYADFTLNIFGPYDKNIFYKVCINLTFPQSVYQGTLFSHNLANMCYFLKSCAILIGGLYPLFLGG